MLFDRKTIKKNGNTVYANKGISTVWQRWEDQDHVDNLWIWTIQVNLEYLNYYELCGRLHYMALDFGT